PDLDQPVPARLRSYGPPPQHAVASCASRSSVTRDHVSDTGRIETLQEVRVEIRRWHRVTRVAPAPLGILRVEAWNGSSLGGKRFTSKRDSWLPLVRSYRRQPLPRLRHSRLQIGIRVRPQRDEPLIVRCRPRHVPARL